jgi:hypothetical protein
MSFGSLLGISYEPQSKPNKDAEKTMKINENHVNLHPPTVLEIWAVQDRHLGRSVAHHQVPSLHHTSIRYHGVIRFSLRASVLR